MSGEVTLTSALRSNLLSLQSTQRLLDQTQQRLATGKKVNSALDDANAFFAAQSLSNRSGDLSRVLDGLGQGIQVLKAADDGITALQSLVEQAESIANEAKSQASGNALEVGGTDVTLAQAADLGAAGIGTITDTDTFTLQAGTSGPVVTFTIDNGESLSDIAAEITAQSGFSAQVVDGTTPGTNVRLQIITTDGSDLIATDADAVLTDLGFATLGGGGTVTASTGVPTDLVQLQNDFDEVRSQIDALIADTDFRGTNLLNGDSLTLDFNEDGSNTITVAGTTLNTSATGLNISAADFDTTSDIDASLTQINSALDKLRAEARSFGTALNIIQTRESFTERQINVLEEGANKLTLADTNGEGAKLLALQTSQQLGITSLSLASQAQQSVLRLF